MAELATRVEPEMKYKVFGIIVTKEEHAHIEGLIKEFGNKGVRRWVVNEMVERSIKHKCLPAELLGKGVEHIVPPIESLGKSIEHIVPPTKK